MKTHRIPPLAALAAFAVLCGVAGYATAGAPVEKRELIYCADRMTPEEREAYRTKLRAARDAGEKDALRAAHRAEMQARAASRGMPGECETAGRQWRGGRKQ